MIDLLSKVFIKDYKNYTNLKVREQYGSLCSIICIICNMMLVTFKLTIGYFSNSIAIIADGLNNLSDVGSNIASLFGFKLANKHPDSDHPYGHGRYEYISGLVIAFLIILVGFQSLKDSIIKIFKPEKVIFSYLALIILIISILVKLWMYYFNNNIGKRINSSTLKAAGQDSLNDVMSTTGTLIALVLTLFTPLPIDGIMGSIVSILVLMSGFEICKDTIDPLLGLAPNKELIKEIEAYILSFDCAIGIHDLMMHDYGPSRKFMTVHVEVDSNKDVLNIHDEIDCIEEALVKKFGILTTIHYDPVDLSNPILQPLKQEVLKIVQSINSLYNIHDFRIVSGNTHTNLIFDVLIPAADSINHSTLKNLIKEKVKTYNNQYECVIHIDHDFS